MGVSLVEVHESVGKSVIARSVKGPKRALKKAKKIPDLVSYSYLNALLTAVKRDVARVSK